MASVIVKMFATVREAAGVSECRLSASNLEELLRELGKLLGQNFADTIARAEREPEVLVVLVNGRNVRPGPRRDVQLSDGDEVSIFPPVSGG